MVESNGKPTAPKPPRLGRGPAFGSDYGSGMDKRTYIATELYAAMMVNPNDVDWETYPTFADAAVDQADELLAALEGS